MGNCLLRARGWGRYHQERKKMQIPRAIPEGGMVTGKLNHALYSLAVAYQDQAAFVLQDRVAHNPEYFASHYVCILPPFPEIKM